MSDHFELPLEYVNALTEFFKVMGEESRVKLIYALSSGEEHCVSELQEAVGMTQSAVSHQLRLLKLKGLVKSRKKGKHVFYSLDDDHVMEILQVSLEHISHKTKEKTGA